MFTIYKLVDGNNRVIYVGQTCRSLKRRLAEHVSRRKDKKLTIIAIDTANSKREAINKEYFWTSFLKNEYGTLDNIKIATSLTDKQKMILYNCSKGKVLSEETKRKISIARKGRKTPQHVIDKILETKRKNNSFGYLKGEQSPWYGRKHTKEELEKMSAANKGSKNHMYGKTGSKHHNSKAVICLDTKIVYGGVSEAGRETKTNPSHISACCLGKRSVAGGKRWCYYERNEAI